MSKRAEPPADDSASKRLRTFIEESADDLFCPITQDIMQDPVKTVDGMTYDRPAIDRWLIQHTTSPLTGLPLSTRNVTPPTIFAPALLLTSRSG